MRRALTIPALVGLAGLCLLPQALSAAKVEGGVKFGVNIAFIEGLDVRGFLGGGGDYDWFMRFGLCGGGFLALPVSEYVAFQAEAQITTKGSHQMGPLFEESWPYSLKITYLEIPVLVRVTTRPIKKNFQLVFMAGPAPAFKLGSRLLLSKERLDYDGVRSSDLGFVLSVGYTITSKKSRGYTEFRYTAGLSRIIEEEGVPLQIRNGVVSLIVGVRL